MANTANSLLSVLQLETNRMGSMHPEKNSQIFLSQFTKPEFVLAKKYLINHMPACNLIGKFPIYLILTM